MALAVTRALNGDQTAVLEAGTGTGKSLAYLVPAALWAVANDSKVAVSTYTIALQAQLDTSDLPLMRRAGLDFRWAVVKGRSNYLCRRRLAETVDGLTDEEEHPSDARLLRSVADWARSAEEAPGRTSRYRSRRNSGTGSPPITTRPCGFGVPTSTPASTTRHDGQQRIRTSSS